MKPVQHVRPGKVEQRVQLATIDFDLWVTKIFIKTFSSPFKQVEFLLFEWQALMRLLILKHSPNAFEQKNYHS